jgi:hypothetical protein
MHWESIPALGLHSRELPDYSGAWPSESLKGDSPPPAGGGDAVAAADGAIEPSGGMAAAAPGEVSIRRIPQKAKYIAM